MADPTILKAGEVADPFGNYTKDKDQARVAPGNPNSPVLSPAEIAEEAVRRRRMALQAMNATTRLKDIAP